MDLNIKKTLLGIDLGTTSLKVSLFTIDGHLVASKSSEYPIITPKVAYAEQDPSEWWQGLIKACQFLSKECPEELNNIAGM